MPQWGYTVVGCDCVCVRFFQTITNRPRRLTDRLSAAIACFMTWFFIIQPLHGATEFKWQPYWHTCWPFCFLAGARAYMHWRDITLDHVVFSLWAGILKLSIIRSYSFLCGGFSATLVPSIIGTENVCLSYFCNGNWLHSCNWYFIMQLHTTTLLLMWSRPIPTMPHYCMYVPMYVCTYNCCSVPHQTWHHICSAASAHLLSYAHAGRLESPRLGLQPSRDLSDLVVQQLLLQQPLLHLSHTGLQLCRAVMQQDNMDWSH